MIVANDSRSIKIRDANGAGQVLEFPSPSPSVNAIPIPVPIPTAGIIFFPVPVPMGLYLKPSPPHHPSKVSNNYIFKVSNKHITKVSNKNTCLKQKYFNINSKSSKVNQSKVPKICTYLEAGRGGMGRVSPKTHPHPHPHPRGGYEFYTRTRLMTPQTGTYPRPDGTGMGRVSY